MGVVSLCKEVEVEVEFDLECERCGNELSGEGSYDTVEIEPCENCINEEAKDVAQRVIDHFYSEFAEKITSEVAGVSYILEDFIRQYAEKRVDEHS